MTKSASTSVCKCKISLRVSFFKDCQSFETAHHKKEKTYSDSALHICKAIEISAMCKIFLIPSSCLRENNIDQVLLNCLFDPKFFTWLNIISASDFNFGISHLFPRSCASNFSFIFTIWVKMSSKSVN